MPESLKSGEALLIQIYTQAFIAAVSAARLELIQNPKSKIQN